MILDTHRFGEEWSSAARDCVAMNTDSERLPLKMSDQRTTSRRSLIHGIVGGVGIALLGRSASAQVNAPGTTEGDCSKLEGLQLLQDWLAQKVVIPPDELRPGGDWQLFTGTVSFFYPKNWTATQLWSSGLTPSGAIDWQTQRTTESYLAGVRVTSPDEQAIYEIVSGTIAGVALDLDSAASAAEQGVLGQGKRIKQTCFYRDIVSYPQNWTHAGTYRKQSVITGGNLTTLNDAYYPASFINYQTFIGPEDDFTSLMRTTYIPIMFQFFVGSGQSPITITGNDDDDDDDDGN